MNTQSNAIPESPLDSQAITPAATSATRPLSWSVRRELWENRSIYVAPLAVAALFLFGFLISTIHLTNSMHAMSALDQTQQPAALDQSAKPSMLALSPYTFAALLIMGTTFIVAVFYCLEALHGERRDRSILFWKSLPVSDLTTVLSKASIPLVILPLLTFAITVATQLIMLLLSTAVLLGSGLNVATPGTHSSWFQMSLMLLYHLVAIHALWYAPIYSWLLLVSGWARRAAFLWAFLPPLAICAVEKIAFNTTHFAALLGYRMRGGPEDVPFTADSMAMNPLMHLHPGQFLSSPDLWLGLIVAALFLAAAVRLRRYQGPI
jgi:ABC-2 type transport system permease protein